MTRPPARRGVAAPAQATAGSRGKTKPKAKPEPKPKRLRLARPAELETLLDLARYAVSRFNEAGVVVAHGTTDPLAEAAFLVCAALHLHPRQFDIFATAKLAAQEREAVFGLIERRIATREPAAYLVNKAYVRGVPFYVDARTIVPRSYLGELLDGDLFADEDGALADPDGVTRVLDLCTGSGCLAILAAMRFRRAQVDAVDLSPDALAVAAKNVADHGMEGRVRLLQGDVFSATSSERYDLIVTNPPYVDAEGMAGLPPECRHEPAMAFDGGADGIAIVRRILDGAVAHLNPEGGLLCEVGRCREALEAAYPDLPFLWLDTAESEGEVFWLEAGALG